MALVGKGSLPPSGPPKGPPPGAKIAIKGSGPPPGKVALPKPPLPGPAAATKPGPLPKVAVGPGSSVIAPKPALGVPDGELKKATLPLAKKDLPKLPTPPAGTKAADSSLKTLLPLKSPMSPTKALPEEIPGALKQPEPGPPSVGVPKSAAAKPVIAAGKGLPGGPPKPAAKDITTNGGAKAAKVPPSPCHPAAPKDLPGTSLPPKDGPPCLTPASECHPDLQVAAKESSGLAIAAKKTLGHSLSITAKGASSPGLPSAGSKLIPPSEAERGNPSRAADGAESLSNVGSPGVDEFGRQRGSVGDLAPKSELTHDLRGNVIPVFDKAGKFVAFASGPPAPLSRSDPTRRSRRLSDRKPQERDTMRMPSARGVDYGALGGLSVPGGVPGFFLSVPPWPAPTPVPMDQAAGWGAYNQFAGHPVPQISPYAAFPPQAVSQFPYPVMYGQMGGRGEEQQGYAPQQGTFEGTIWPGYPEYPIHQDAKDACGAASRGAPAFSKVAFSPKAPPPRESKSRKSKGLPLDDFEVSRVRCNAVARGDEEVGKSKWMPIERHLNNIRGGYGEAYRPPEEEAVPPREPSARARRRSSSVRDDVYSGFRPYYIRDKKPFVDEDGPRFVDPNGPSGRVPAPPRKTPLMTRPKDRTWDRWGSTGLTAPRKRTYQSLSELASCFSNLEAEDQDDVISLLLLCRKLEQQVEKQHVVIDMLEHELSEAQKVLKFPPEWRTLEGLDLAGMVPSDAPFQATAATPLYIKSASVLPSSVPDDPNASFGVGVPLTRENKGTSAATPSPAKSAAAAPAGGAAPKPAGGNVEATKKPPALFKPKASVVGFKKPVFKKM